MFGYVEVNSIRRYCAECKNDENEIVKAGEKLKFSKKKANTVGLTSERNWGSGMATVGRIKECTIVPVNHFGPVPGVEVGTRWKFRIGVSSRFAFINCS